MGEFKKGDFVRVIDNKGAPDDYRVGDVHKVDAVLDGLVYVLGKPGMFAKRFEPWQPRVGERVRYTGKSTIYREKELIGIEGVVEETGTRFVVVNFDKAIVDGVRTGGAKYIENLEPIIDPAVAAEQPATLKIEAGKFYKTRAGRKVGPVRLKATHGSDGPYRIDGLWNYLENGLVGSISNGDHKDDIIAEWIDEPVAKPSNDNAKPKFKVGDRVKSVEKGPTGGYVGVIIEDDESVVPFLVAFDDWDEGHGSADNEWWLQESEIIAAPSTTTIVAIIENGQPKPSSTPHVHASTDSAEKEAKRLAAKYKGKQFGVFTLTTTHEEAAPVYDHKWQNMAALGLKIDAIKELRAVAGLDLLSAKRAVEAFEQAA